MPMLRTAAIVLAPFLVTTPALAHGMSEETSCDITGLLACAATSADVTIVCAMLNVEGFCTVEREFEMYGHSPARLPGTNEGSVESAGTACRVSATATQCEGIPIGSFPTWCSWSTGGCGVAGTSGEIPVGPHPLAIGECLRVQASATIHLHTSVPGEEHPTLAEASAEAHDGPTQQVCRDA